MKDRQLIPGITTYFRWTGTFILGLTQGKIYKILEWRDDFYYFLDDERISRMWWRQNGVEDISYEENLKEVLE